MRLIEEAIKKRQEIIDEQKYQKKMRKSASASLILLPENSIVEEERKLLLHIQNIQKTELKSIIEHKLKITGKRKKKPRKIKKY